MSEGSAGRTVGAKTFVALMTIMIIAFIAGLLVMNLYYTSMQSELATTKAQVAGLQTDLYNLNQNYTLLMEVRNYLLNQVSDLSGQINLTQVYSRTFSHNIYIEIDNRTYFYNNGTVIRAPIALLSGVFLSPQAPGVLVADPWSAPLPKPQWLLGPGSEPMAMAFQTSAIRAYFIQPVFNWTLLDSYETLEPEYREHHDLYTVAFTGSLQLLYFNHNKTVSFVLIDINSDLQGQVSLVLP